MRIGIDIGGSHIAVGLINEMGRIIEKCEKNMTNDLKREEYSQELIEAIIEKIQEVLDKAKIDITKINLIGISVPGIVSDTEIIKADNLHIKNLEIVKEINEYYNVPIRLRNDAKCAAVAEKEYGSLKPAEDALFLTIGTGIGGAVFLRGNLLAPKKYEGFEVGHMIIQKDGLQCNCGRKGCFEKYASMDSLKKNIAKKLGKETISGEELKEILTENKNEVSEIVDDYIDFLSIGIANLINIFEPEIISLGGSFAFYEDTLLEKLKNRIEKEELFYKTEKPKIVLAKLQNDAGIIGSVL